MRKSVILIISILLSVSSVVTAQNQTATAGAWQITVDNAGRALIEYDGKILLSSNEAVWGLNNNTTSFSSLTGITVTQKTLQDAIGEGIELTISGRTLSEPITRITHKYYIYNDKDYILTEFSAVSGKDLSINYMAPVSTHGSSQILDGSDNYALFVPFDNDMWVRYKTTPFGSDHPLSFEVSALFNASSRRGLVVGSVEHDVWKTGIGAVTSGDNTLTSLSVYGGATSQSVTHDVLPHGTIVSTTVKSPKVMIGYFEDWRTGLETYADVCEQIAPRLECMFEKPFGWNSWGMLQDKITYDKANEVSLFFAEELQPEGFLNADSTVFIGLDSFWDFGFSVRNHMSFVRNCKARGQKAGIYWTPFTEWGKNPETVVPGTDGQYTYGDIYLYDNNGNVQEIDGGYALDPTHPATKARIKYQFDWFVQWGYEFVKIDFMTHGALEGKHYDPDVFTGIQAYSQGMQYLADLVGDKMFINLSIAPLFPANYAHSRRIGCDSYRSISETEYTLNSLSYGWWLDHVYSYNDADHVVLDGASVTENRARVTSSVITGIYIVGDDFSAEGTETSKSRAKTYLTNKEVNQVARVTKAFRPVESAEGESSADMFVYNVGDTAYVAVFNYNTTQNQKRDFDFARLGLVKGQKYCFRELWTGVSGIYDDTWSVTVRRSDAQLYKIYPYDDSGVATVADNTPTCYYDAVTEELRLSEYMTDSVLYDVAGSCVAQYHGCHSSVDVSGLHRGLYIYQGRNSGGECLGYKFIK